MQRDICLKCDQKWTKEMPSNFRCPWKEIAEDDPEKGLSDEDWRTKIKPPDACPFHLEHVIKDQKKRAQ